jgi:cytochrome P450
MCKKALASRSKALDVLEEWYQSILDEEAKGKNLLNDPEFPFFQMPAACGEEHFSRRDTAVVLLGAAWALLANAPVAAIWCVIKLIEHPDAMARVRSEIEIGLRESADGKIETLIQTLSIINSDHFGFLGSVIQETLRWTSSSYSIRRVTADTVIPYPVGSPGSLVHKGDMVVCVTSMNHSDPTIYSNPGEWIAERFTSEFKKGRADRGEKDVTNGFLPFGGGVSMCEGM